DLPAPERMAKSLLAMLNFGVLDRDSFQAQFGCSLDQAFGPALAFALDQGWLEDRGTHLGVPPGRFGELPRVRALFYAPPACASVEQEGSRLPILARDAHKAEEERSAS